MLRQYVSGVLTNVVGIGVYHRFARIYYIHRQGSHNRETGCSYEMLASLTILHFFYNLQNLIYNFNRLQNLILQSSSVITS